MERTPQQRRLARWTLALGAALALGYLATVDFSRRISTNVIDLLPAREQDAELQLMRTLASDVQARVIWCLLKSPEAVDPAATQAFVASLRQSEAFAAAEALGENEGRETVGRLLFERRFDYLLPEWLAAQRAAFAATGQSPEQWPAWLAETAATALDAFLAQPESGAFEDVLPADPLLLLPRLAEDASALLPSRDDETKAAVWGRTRESPFAEGGQAPVFTAVADALIAARAIQPGVELEWSSIHRFAAASKARIRHEVSFLNALALVGVTFTTCLLMRRPWRALHLLPVVACSVLGAWAVVLLWFEQVHVLVFVLGALLSGAAVDYGFHLGVHAARGVSRRMILKPLLASCLTTVLGFALLGWSDLPLLQQLSVFVCSGLLCALAAALLYSVQLADPGIEARPWPHRQIPRAVRFGAVALALFVAFGLVRLTWRDDLRDLQIEDADLVANDHAVRAQLGSAAGGTIYLVRGDSFADVRTRIEGVRTWYAQHFPDETAASALGLLPTPAEWAALPDTVTTLSAFPGAFRRALEERGYLADEFEPFFSDWDRWREGERPAWATLWEDVQSLLPGPLLDTFGQTAEAVWATVMVPREPAERPPAELRAVSVHQLESMNDLFRRYRHQALTLSLIGLGLLGVTVLGLYGLRRGWRVFLVPAGAIAVTFGLLGWLGVPLNLFHLLGAFLGVCLSHDYAIFAAESRGTGEAAPASIRLSALTTAASFGVLALSKIPVVAALGLSVTLMVLVAWLAVELRSTGSTAS